MDETWLPQLAQVSEPAEQHTPRRTSPQQGYRAGTSGISLQDPKEGASQRHARLERTITQKPDRRHRRLLRPRCKRPRRRTPEQRDELAPFYLTELHLVHRQPDPELQNIELGEISQEVMGRFATIYARASVGGLLGLPGERPRGRSKPATSQATNHQKYGCFGSRPRPNSMRPKCA